MTNLSKIDEYIKTLAPSDTALIFGEDDLPSGVAFTEAVKKLLLSARWHPFIRRALVKRLFSALFECGYIGECKLRFSWFMRERAYMKDSGLACFSMHYLGVKDGAYLCMLVLHEVAHLKLSCVKDYAKLLLLNREFKEKRHEKNSMLLSPIEVLATRLSIAIMRNAAEEIGERGDGLMKMAEAEAEKLLRAQKEIIAD